MTGAKPNSLSISLYKNKIDVLYEKNNEDEMQVEYSLSIDKKSLQPIFNSEYEELASTVKVNGFRKGKVPVSYVKKHYKNEVLKETIEKLINAASLKLIEDLKLKIAVQPKINIKNASEEEGISFELTAYLLPEIKLPDFSKFVLEKLSYEITEDEINKFIDIISANHKAYSDSEEGYKAKMGDTVLIDFEGKIDNELFPGGSAKEVKLELGSKQFIDNFEEQLVGTKSGDNKLVKVTFPKDYHVQEHSGKKAQFDVSIQKVMLTTNPIINDELATKLGAKDLNDLKEMIKTKLKMDYDRIVEQKMKIDLFDLLDKDTKFKAPKVLLDNEFKILKNNLQEINKDNLGKEKLESDDEIRKLADRRVRLGILISEAGKERDVKIEDKELIQAVMNQARNYPGQENEIIEYYRKHPRSVENLRGPILEDKVVKLILDEVKTTEKKVSIDDLVKIGLE
jgi:trigger factor